MLFSHFEEGEFEEEFIVMKRMRILIGDILNDSNITHGLPLVFPPHFLNIHAFLLVSIK